jgi:hypothetical protein
MSNEKKNQTSKMNEWKREYELFMNQLRIKLRQKFQSNESQCQRSELLNAIYFFLSLRRRLKVTAHL